MTHEAHVSHRRGKGEKGSLALSLVHMRKVAVLWSFLYLVAVARGQSFSEETVR